MTTPAAGTAASPLLRSGFEYRRIDVEGIMINCAIGGSGPPLLMLHGYPENHLMWRHVAPGLARDHTVVLADLRGYGDSGKPAPDADGNAYSKRLMARDQVGLMRHAVPICANSVVARSAPSGGVMKPARNSTWAAASTR